VGLGTVQTLNFLSGERRNALPSTGIQPDKDKIDTLFRLLCRIGDRSAVVFCNHRESVERTSTLLRDKGIVNVFYHGAMEQPERDSALAKFRNGSSDVLVTTDLASRGLDVPNIRYIIHFHLPLPRKYSFTATAEQPGWMPAERQSLSCPRTNTAVLYSRRARDYQLPATATLPAKPKWTTLYIQPGRKDKVNKVDVVGFFTHKGQLKKEDIGLIEK